ncbi:MAG: diaminopimelate epimerase [Bacteroidetes bacterium]|nr:diaminopimelate epimerase [Bacteroidota bacterium]
MKIKFHKYQGTGNDFIIIDNREKLVDRQNAPLFNKLCDRKFGIGADGVILLENHDSLDFNMIYFNADGNESSMCGNGGRCITAFAESLGMISGNCKFEATDGIHQAEILGDGIIKLQMSDVTEYDQHENFFVVNTGSPHYVKYCSGVSDIDIVKEGREIRQSNEYKAEGINVDFIEKENDRLMVRTYERGVEDETLACGTGVVASVLAAEAAEMLSNGSPAQVITPGGELTVYFEKFNGGYNNIWLEGPVEFVYYGEINT